MKYDVAVIGGGPGGYVAAIRAGKLGLKTVLFEKDQLGGTCLNRGCIPTKALLKSVHLYWEAGHAEEYGIHAAMEPFDFSQAMHRKDEIVTQLRTGVKGLLRNSGVEVVHREAKLIDAHRIEADGTIWETENVILASGSKAVLPKGISDTAMTSDDFWSLAELPNSVVIVGGGVIGVEFAEMLSGAGCKVTILELAERLVAAADPDISKILFDLLEKKGVEIHLQARVTDCLPGEVRFETKEGASSLKCDSVLVSVGRAPSLSTESLEKLGIRCDRGKIRVNERMETSLPHVYAIGDLVAGPMLAHKASAEGLAAVQSIAGGNQMMRYDRIPQCIYTQPEAAWVGMSAQEAEQCEQADIFTYPIGHNGKSMADGEKTGFIRLISNRDTGEILGAQLVCSHASDMIGEILAAMQAEACIEDLADLISPHPTLCEGIMEAAAGICGRGIHTI